MQPDGRGRTRLEYVIPARGLIGFQNEFLTLTRGTGLMSHIFHEYAPLREGSIGERRNGVLISQDNGDAVAYALWKLQDRGRMFVSPGEPLYEGMIIGIHSRDNDLVVNPIKGKQLTNVRASGTDEAVRLVPPIQMSLEYAVEFIDDDELVEITPSRSACASATCKSTSAAALRAKTRNKRAGRLQAAVPAQRVWPWRPQPFHTAAAIAGGQPGDRVGRHVRHGGKVGAPVVVDIDAQRQALPPQRFQGAPQRG